MPDLAATSDVDRSAGIRTRVAGSPRFFVPVWLAAYCAVLLIGAWITPLTRTQEARVLETARQMSSKPWIDWMIPKLNGELRLHKPPLAYWYTATMFEVFGVGKFNGRIPSIVLMAGTLLLTYAFGRDVLCHEAGLMAVLLLSCSFFFLRFGRLAETDTPATFSSMLGFWAALRGMSARRRRSWLGWNHLLGLALAASVMTKGATVGFILAFLTYLCVIHRTSRPLTDFVRSGGLLTSVVLGAPWFIFVLVSTQTGTIAAELQTLATGRNHRGMFYEYIPELLLGTLPCTPLYICAIVAMVRRWRSDASVRIIAGTGVAVFLPLSCVLNNQPHYLLPMMPGCALLTSWWLCRSSASEKLLPSRRWVTVGATAIGLIPILVDAWRYGEFTGASMVTAALFAACVMTTRRVQPAPNRTRRLSRTAAPWAIAFTWFFAVWTPSLQKTGLDRVADAYRERFGNASLCNIGRNVSVVLGFELQQRVSVTTSLSGAIVFLEKHPTGVILYETDRPADFDLKQLAPHGIRLLLSVPHAERRFDFYGLFDSDPPPSSFRNERTDTVTRAIHPN